MHSSSASGDRSCFVHAGTHKTGTTAIQRFLAGNRQQLAAAGLYYPHSGLLSDQLPGHHNVAFELCGDERFDPAAGTLADVTRELARAAPPRVCLSSEVFQYLHADHAGLVTLRDALAATGYRGVIVLYVRAQDDYLESLYAELVKHGLQLPFTDVLEAVMRSAVIRHDRVWAFRFDYMTLANRFAAVFGAGAVTVRHYRHGGSADTIVRDFLGATAAAPAAVVGAEPAAYENARLTTGGVIAQLFANTAADAHDERIAAAGAELVGRYPREAAEPFRPLAPAERARVAARFADDNARLAQRWPAAAGIARRRPAEVETERARGARSLFEFAESSRRTYAAAAGGFRFDSASHG